MDSRYLQRWPQLRQLAGQKAPVYVLPTVAQLTQACSSGELLLSGQDYILTRLDMALIGLMQEFGEDYFHDDIFVSRLLAAHEILLAAEVFLSQRQQKAAKERVKLLAAEAETALELWNELLTPPEAGQTLLFAAEDNPELT